MILRMKVAFTLVNVVALALVIGGVVMRIYRLPDEQLSLMVSLLGLLIYLLAWPKPRRVPPRRVSRNQF